VAEQLAVVEDTTIMLRQHAAAQPTPQQRGRLHLMLEARDPTHLMLRLSIAAAARHIAVAAADIKAASTGRLDLSR
jgi:hypothetical protein